ncbi:hypothetical protein P4V54_20145 [Brevibacillus nitrificans]|uniref:hypothetical protein n=1 Tax=Brevibacillus nitrificans TaxID=651560 RepID=UPI002E1A9ECF|nr:hypothetical protein [Brevibacillus nitrificans]
MNDKKFSKELKSILFYVLEYGMRNIPFKLSMDALKQPELKREFISKVHKGFMLAQNLIIQNLLLLGKEKAKNKDMIKESNRQQKSKDVIQGLKQDLKRIEYQENVLRKIADTIAWQILNNDITVIRRLYNFSSQVEIYNSNLKHDLQVVEEMFEKDNETFPLITDITSFIQIGDLLIKDRNVIKVVELKEGKVNEEISNMLDEHFEFKCDRKLFFELEEKGEKFQKQFFRYVKQQSTALNSVGIINRGEGTDSQGRKIKIIDDVFYTKHFTETVESMLEKVNKRNYSINYIENCLAIGVYNVSRIPIHTAFEAWKKSIDIDFPTVDIRAFINGSVTHPLFLHPFSLDDKVKLVMGKKVILMSLNINEWLKMFERKNAVVRLLSKKETARLNNTPNHLKAFEYNGQAIEIEHSNIKQIIHDGIFERMFNQFLTPSSAVDFLIQANSAGFSELSEVTKRE